MNIDKGDRALWVKGSLGLFPPCIINEVIGDPSFRHENEISVDATIKFLSCNSGFRNSKVLAGIREAFNKEGSAVSIIDDSGSEWVLCSEREDTNVLVRLSNDTQAILLDVFWPLAVDSEERLRRLSEKSDEYLLPVTRRNYWRNILSTRCLSDDELIDLQEDFEDTAYHVACKIKQSMESGSSEVVTLIPQNSRYYERLVGRHIDSDSISTYANTEAVDHINDLLTYNSFSGLQSLFLTASINLLTRSFENRKFDEQDLLQLFDWVITDGDLISKTGAIEFGLSLVDEIPSIEPKVEAIIRQLIVDDVDDPNSEYCLLVSLIVLVDGEISRLQIFHDKPPFYRRLASIAQASLIIRCVKSVGIENSSFSDWSLNQRGMVFYCQSFIDLRSEPRWQPDYLTATQLRSELLGRVFNASKRTTLNINNEKLSEVLFGTGAGCIQDNINLSAFLPGPLEGNVVPNDVPSDISQIIETGLKSGAATPEAFVALVNSVQYWKLDPRYTGLALKILSDAEHQLSQTDNSDKILYTLNGLARAACIVKSEELAVALSILTRRYRLYLDVHLNPVQVLVIGMVAAAAYKDHQEWAKFLGEWATELSYLDLSLESARNLRHWIKQLCILDPVLYCTCGQSLAVLEALID